MKRLLIALTLFSALTSLRVAHAQAPEDLAKYLPAETFLYVNISNLGDLIEINEDGAIYQLLQHEAVKRVFEGLYSAFDFLDNDELMLDLDLDPKEIAQLIHGRIAMAIPNVRMKESDLDATGSGANIELSLELGRGGVMLADFDGTAERFTEVLDNLVKIMEEKRDATITIIPEEVNGVELLEIEVRPNDEEEDAIYDDEEGNGGFFIALWDGLIILSDKRDTAEDMIDRVKNGAPEGDRLTDEPRYLETQQNAGDRDVLMYVNFGEVGGLVNQLIEHQIAKMGNRVEMYVTAKNLIESLGLDAFWSTYVSLRVEDEEVEIVFGLTHEDREQGLATLITYQDGGVEIPTFFNDEFHSASVSSYDLSKAWTNFEGMLKKASPYAHMMLDVQLSNLEANFPLRDALLDNFDGLLIDVLGYPDPSTADPKDQPSQAYVVRVKDPQSLSEALEEFGDMNTEEDPVDFMNTRIYQVPLPIPIPIGPSPILSFTVSENYLIAVIGDPKMVENVVAHIKNPGKSLFDDELLMDALDALPNENVVSLGFADVSDLLLNSIRGTEDTASIMIATSNDDVTVERARTAQKMARELPDVSDIDFFLVAKTYRTPETFVQRTLIRRGR